MKNLTLKQLRYFDALARHGHFGLAADSCAISQPALSMQIKELEAGLPAQLFERSPKGLRLTHFGQGFAERARAILRDVDGLGDFVRTRSQDGRAGGGMVASLGGRLALGVIPTVAPYYLPQMMRLMQTTFAGLEVNLREAMTQTLLADLQDGRLDAAIIALPMRVPDLTEAPLFSEDFVLVRPAAEAGHPVPSPHDLREMRLLLLEEGHCFRDQALAFCAISANASPREVMDGSGLTTLVQMVSAGMGVTLIPDMAVPVETRAANICIQRFAAPRPQRHIGMVWRKTAPFTPALARIAEVLRGAGA